MKIQTNHVHLNVYSFNMRLYKEIGMITIQLFYKFTLIKFKLIRRYIRNGYFNAIKSHNNLKLKRILKLYPQVIKNKNSLGLTGLMQAVASRNYDAITLLLQSGIDPNVMDQDGWTAKAWAILMNDHESLKRLSQISVLTYSLDKKVCGMAIVGIGTILSDKTLAK